MLNLIAKIMTRWSFENECVQRSVIHRHKMKNIDPSKKTLKIRKFSARKISGQRPQLPGRDFKTSGQKKKFFVFFEIFTDTKSDFSRKV